MSNTTAASSGGIGFTGLLTILFIGLKLTGYIDWSWWLVLIFPVIGVSIAGIALLILLIAMLCGKVNFK